MWVKCHNLGEAELLPLDIIKEVPKISYPIPLPIGQYFHIDLNGIFSHIVHRHFILFLTDSN